MRFDELTFEPHCMGAGVQARVDFPNGYGASVIRTPFSYGGNQGLYELAVMHNGYLCYDSGITDDVLGGLSEVDVTKTLKLIEALPPKTESTDNEKKLKEKKGNE